MNCFQRTGACAIILAFAPAAWSAGNEALSQVQQQYKQERAHCLSGQSHQDRATCLKEAQAAYQEGRRGALVNRSASSDFSKNAMARCEAQPTADRDACVQRITGAGSAQGSVKGGGVIRQTETKVQ
ncbi:MAG: hypothetical protein H0X13_02795 [Ramlibacter sp.]|nr:hypothetical protein [Ramlibacter sp.]